jgi:hypothetical protein
MSIMPRVLFTIGAFCLNLIARSLHCQAGRPHTTWEPPGWA